MSPTFGEPIPRIEVTDAMYVASCLSNDKPTSELGLNEWLRGQGWDTERIERAINGAQAQNLIRWVQFEGWCAGGRPA